MRRFATTLFTAAVVAAFFVGAAEARTVCAPRQQLVDGVARSHGERPVALGLAANGTMFEVLASAAGSWTAIVTRPQGRSCVVATGEAWEAVAPPAAPEDAT